MYQYAAGDIRGITAEMVRGPSPEAARAKCIALGVPAEHVETWAVRSDASEHAAEVRRLEGEVKRAEKQRAAERRRDVLQVAIDTALDQLYRIQLADLCALDAGRVEAAIKALGDV